MKATYQLGDADWICEAIQHEGKFVERMYFCPTLGLLPAVNAQSFGKKGSTKASQK